MKLKTLLSYLIIAFLSAAALALSALLYARYLYPDADYTQIMLTLYSLSPDVIKQSIYPSDYLKALIFFFIVWPVCYLYLTPAKQFIAAAIMSICAIYLLGWPEYIILSHTTSTLYEEHYIYPDKQTPAPANKRNIIIIYLESFEQNYTKTEHYEDNLLKSLQSLQTQDNHSLEYRALNSTNYSIGALVATQCGIPLIFSQERDMYINTFFLPETICFPEILKANGYQTEIIKAADIHFTDADKFAKTHGYDKAWGKDQIIEQYPEFKQPKYQGTFGGLSDRALYEVAKKELAEFSLDKPFLLTLFSLDTHTPTTHIDASCPTKFNDLRDAYMCADKAAADFINWLKTSPYWQDTTVVILGDHLLPGRIKTKGHPKRTIFNVFLNLPQNLKISENKEFSALDIPASILESLGFKLQNHSFGLGRSIFSKEPTLLTKFGRKLNRYLMQHSDIYQKLSNPATAHVDVYAPYTINTTIENHDCTQYTDIFEDMMGLYYLDRLNLSLVDLPSETTALDVHIKFNTLFSKTGVLTISANGKEIVKFHPEAKQKAPYTLNFTIPRKLIKNNQLQLKFHNNSNTRHILTLGIAPLEIHLKAKEK